jgi:4a-hydroxytetrahydrobiopterin dehydratase
MPTRLSEPLLTDALSRLAGWAGDPESIRREFVLDGVARQRLVVDIAELARSTRHEIRVTDTPVGLAVTLSTDDVAGVSEVDVAVASRLNDLFAGTPERIIPRQRQAQLNATGDGESGAVGSDERRWWDDSDKVEPFMGVPATNSGVMPIPLPDTAPDEPEPGVEGEQEGGAGEGLGFSLRGPADPPPTA